MPSNIAVNFESLATAEQQINQCAQQIQSQLDDLHSMLQPLVSTWTGSAYEQYQVQQQAWLKAQNDALQVLTGIGKVVAQAHEAYVNTENANRQAWGN